MAPTKYSTKLKGKKALHPAVAHKLRKTAKRRMSKLKPQRSVRRLALFTVFFLYFSIMLGGVGTFSYLHAVSQEIPPVETPFNAFGLTSKILDRYGTELYKLTGDYVRAPLDINTVPEHVKWAFIAAEDINFYDHGGFDALAMARCGVRVLDNNPGAFCGGSTITQQLIKTTVVGNELSIERKIKELIMAIKVEQPYSKDQILEQYLSVVPMGSNLYGLTMGANFYFGKQPKDLNLGEATLLASIIQNPVFSSPTLGLPDPETAKKVALQRQQYVLGQLEKHMEFINQQTRIIRQDPELDDVITPDLLQQAKEQELVFRAPILTNKNAGHFIDYVQKMLITRPYNNGQPFTPAELAFGGYSIYTTLDYPMQQLAEQTVAQAVAQRSDAYGVHNGAMLTMVPSTGEILVMVGSKSYSAASEGCDANGNNCVFNPQVNVLATGQSPGSSTKTFGTYEAYRTGALYTGSLLPDIAIDVGGGYNIKNWNGTFFGVSPKTTAGQMLCESRNLPAVQVIETIGVQRFVQVMQEFGYSTYTNPDWYGHSVILGGAEVLGIEHAQAHGVFANGGSFVQHEVIRKIVDSEGNVIFEHKPAPKQIADERAVYMINQSLLNCFQASWDGRQVAAKTGTSEDNMDGWTVMWSPDFVTVGWMGNNNNRPMSYSAFGVSIVMPWLKTFMMQVGTTDYFGASRQFSMPAGLKVDGGRSFGGNVYGFAAGLMFAEHQPKLEAINSYKMVCKDQPDRLARQEDIDAGMAEQKLFSYYINPVGHWQRFLDAYLLRSGIPNGGPTQYCTVDRG